MNRSQEEDSAQAASGAACGRFGGRGRRASVVCSLTMARMKVRDRLERAGVTQGGIVGVSRENHTAHARDQRKSEEQTRTSNVTKTGRKLGADASGGRRRARLEPRDHRHVALKSMIDAASCL